MVPYDGEVTVDVSLDGGSAAGTARIATLVSTIDGPDGTIERTATDCGSEPHRDSDGSAAADRWAPNLPGEYTIMLTGTSTGTWTPSFGSITDTDRLVTVVVSNEPVTDEVVEIQTVRVPNP